MRRHERLAVQVLDHHVGGHRLEHRHLDRLAFPGARAVVERREHRGEHGERAGLVGDDGRHVARLAGERRLERREPARRLDHVVVGRLVAVRPRRAEAVGRAVDEPGIHGANGFVLEAEPRRRLRAEIVHHHVRGLGEPEQRLPARLVLQVEDDAALVAIAREEERRHPRMARGPEPARRVALRRLDLDHVGPHVAQHLRRPRPEHDRGDVEYPNSREWSRHGLTPSGRSAVCS